MKNQKKLFLLDAYALIYRAYFAFVKNPRVNSKGINTSAVFGFTNSLLEIIRKESPTHLAVVFDTGNTVAHGHDIYNEIVILGDLISHIHLKDKDLNNENVLLGTGLVDFYSIMQSLNEINYSGPFTFETHRGRDPIATAIHNRNFIEFLDSQFV